MLSFSQFLQEKVLSIGFNPKHEEFREKHRDQIHDLLQNAYKQVDGGYGGLGSGSKEESEAIHRDISDHNIKVIKRGDKITAANIYKDQYGRKSIATGHDGTAQGKKDWKQIATEDIKDTERGAWSESSGRPYEVRRYLGAKEVPFDDAKKLLRGKKITQVGDTNRYVRDIGGEPHEKVIIGNPKIPKNEE